MYTSFRALSGDSRCSTVVVTQFFPMLNRDEDRPTVIDIADRRRAARVPQSGQVVVCAERGEKVLEFHAVLMDASAGGLAIRHWNKDLAPGQQVRIAEEQRGEIRARVRWNWAVGPVVISGLETEQPADVVMLPVRQANTSRLSMSPTVRTLIAAVAGSLLLMIGWHVGSSIISQFRNFVSG